MLMYIRGQNKFRLRAVVSAGERNRALVTQFDIKVESVYF